MIDNHQKYLNYKEQFERLKKAIISKFYLEAIFIEYSILEDRLECAIKVSNSWTFKDDTFVCIDQKIKKLSKIREEKKSLAHKYFSTEQVFILANWKEKRNKLVHALLKQSISTEELYLIATEGANIARKFSNKVNSYKRAIEKAG